MYSKKYSMHQIFRSPNCSGSGMFVLPVLSGPPSPLPWYACLSNSFPVKTMLTSASFPNILELSQYSQDVNLYPFSLAVPPCFSFHLNHQWIPLSGNDCQKFMSVLIIRYLMNVKHTWHVQSMPHHLVIDNVRY